MTAMRYQLFIKHFLNRDSAREREFITNWRSIDPANNKIYYKFEKYWKEGKFLETYNLYNKTSLLQAIGKKATES